MDDVAQLVSMHALSNELPDQSLLVDSLASTPSSQCSTNNVTIVICTVLYCTGAF